MKKFRNLKIHQKILFSNYFVCDTDMNKIISTDSYLNHYEEMRALKQIRECFSNSRILYGNPDYNLQILGFNGKNYSPADTGEVNVTYPDIAKVNNPAASNGASSLQRSKLRGI